MRGIDFVVNCWFSQGFELNINDIKFAILSGFLYKYFENVFTRELGQQNRAMSVKK
jgi:hypothetical protein